MSNAAEVEMLIDERVHERRWWILAVLGTSLMIVIVGNTVLNVALPTLSAKLGASTSQLQWIVDGYSLVFAGMLFTAGALGDRFGRKGALQFGLLTFLGGSIFAAFTPYAWATITGRIIMGFGAAFIMPATLSILTNVFSAAERPKAIAIWAAISFGGAAIGPVISGFLLEHFWWGSVFLVNIPIITFALVAGFILLPKTRDPEQGKLDPVGALLSIAGLSALVYAIIEAPDHGWLSGTTLAFFAAALTLIGLFLAWERRVAEPMLDLTLFRNRKFSVAAAGITLVYFGMFGSFFLMAQYFQAVLGYSAFKAGLTNVPFALTIILVAPKSPRLIARFGANKVIAGGLISVATSQFLMTIVGINTPFLVLLPVFMLMSAGMANIVAPLTTSIMSAVPARKAGVGSAMNDTTRELGGSLGVAVIGSIAASRFTSKLKPSLSLLPPEVRSIGGRSVSAAVRTAAKVGGEPGKTFGEAARRAYMSGSHRASFVAGTVILCAAIVVYRLLPGRPGLTEPLPSEIREMSVESQRVTGA
jgi:EmrB/QacA subfamily drug resistance transporter